MSDGLKNVLIFVLFATGTVMAAQPTPDLPPTADASAGKAEPASDEAAPEPAESAEPAGRDQAAKSKTEGGKPEASGTAEAAGEEAVMPPETPDWRDVLDDVLSSGAIGLLREGGFFMWPILIMGIIATGVIIERYRSLKMLSTDTAQVRSDVANLLRSDRVEEALQACDSQQGPVPAVLSAGVRKFFVLRRLEYDPGRIEEQVIKAMDDYSVHIVAALERHLPILATVSSAAPMLGFLGTVQGMIIAFRDIVAKMGETNVVEAAASGIQTALLTTCFGLIVGIPAYIGYNYFTSVINRYVLDVEQSATELIETVTLHMALEQREAGA